MLKKKGFTLVELLTVIVILGAILALSIPSVMNAISNSRQKTYEYNLNKLKAAAKDYVVNKGIRIDNKEQKIINITQMIDASYIKEVKDPKSQKACEGFVTVMKDDNNYIYEPYLKCSDYISDNYNNISKYLPTITILGSNPINIYIGNSYIDAGASAKDYFNVDISSKIIATSNINTSIPGTYTVTYRVMDDAGNVGTATRSVNVIDNVSPTITFDPNSNTTYAKSRDAVIKVSDIGGLNDSSLKYVWSTSTTQPSLSLFTSLYKSNQAIGTPASITGIYYLWAMASDRAGNQAIKSSGSFYLDNIKPVITLNGNNSVTIGKGSTYTDAGATATDTHSGVNGSVIATGTINPNIVGSYTITYNVTDKAGNAADPVIRIVNVVDVSAPVITILGSNPINIGIGSVYSDAGATALDDVDGDVTSKITTTSNVNPNVLGTYTVTYTVKDTAGNTATATRTVNVIDNIPPTVAFGTNGFSSPILKTSTTVTVSDAHTGVNTSSLKYLWNTSTTAPSEGSFSTVFTNGGTISTPPGVDGNYYLWILAKDTLGNTAIVRSNAFNLSSTTPASCFAFSAGTITGYTISSTCLTDVVIPSTIGGVNVTTIGSNAFENKNIISVTFPSTLKTIGDFSFGNNKLTSLIIPSGVTTIGFRAFVENQIASLTLPNTITSIGGYAFISNKLTSITIPTSLTIIDGYVFASNQLSSITIPNNITSIGAYAFYGNLLTTLTIPGSIKEIGYNAFSSNQVSSLTIQNGVEKISEFGFGNNKLTSITVPNSVTMIKNQAFAYNNITQGNAKIDNFNGGLSITSDAFDYNGASRTTNITPTYLRSVPLTPESCFAFSSGKIIGYTTSPTCFTALNIPSTIGGVTVTAIGSNVFEGKNIISVIFPSTLKTIGDFAFTNNKITDLTIPNGVTTLGFAAFASNQIKSLSLPNSLINLGDITFSGNQLTNITIPPGITKIGYSTFADNQLTSVTIPGNVKEIGQESFVRNQISNLTIEDGVERIMYVAFSSNKLTSVTIPNSVTNIYDVSFAYNNITQGNAKIDNYNGGLSVASDAFSNNGPSKTTNVTPTYLRSTPTLIGITTKTYTEGESVSYLGNTWRVMKDNGTSVQLILNRVLNSTEVAANAPNITGAYSGATVRHCLLGTPSDSYCYMIDSSNKRDFNWENSITRSIVKNWLRKLMNSYNAGINIELISMRYKTTSTYDYVRLPFYNDFSLVNIDGGPPKCNNNWCHINTDFLVAEFNQMDNYWSSYYITAEASLSRLYINSGLISNVRPIITVKKK